MTNKRILILGGGIMQVPAINLAKGMGLSVIVADGKSDVPGRKIADYFEQVDLKDHRGMIETALRYKKEGGLDGVFTAGTDFSQTVAMVAEAAGLPGIPVEAAVNASNKGRMREVLHSAGIPVPMFMEISDLEELDECSNIGPGNNLAFPLVVKPVDNMGARGIRRVDSCSELKAAALEAFRFSASGRIIVEEYLSGPEYSLDALVYDGEVHVCGVADRHIFFPPYFVEMGHTIPSGSEPYVIEEVMDVFKRSISAVGITEGAAKGDIKWSGDRAFVGEIAARLSGGYMSGWTYPYSSGIEVTRSAIRIALGLPPEDLTPVVERTAAERALISIPGEVADIQGRDEPFSLGGVKHVFIRVSAGDSVSFPTNNVEKCGNCIAVSETRKDAVFLAEEGCRRIFIRLKPGTEATERFLFLDREGWIPDAFTLNLEKNTAVLDSLEPVCSGNSTEVKIPLLPDLAGEYSLDWHGKSLSGAFDEVLRITGCSVYSYGEDAEGILAGKLFYRAFLRGSVQGGVWLVDTLREAAEKDEDPGELFQKWES